MWIHRCTHTSTQLHTSLWQKHTYPLCRNEWDCVQEFPFWSFKRRVCYGTEWACGESLRDNYSTGRCLIFEPLFLVSWPAVVLLGGRGHTEKDEIAPIHIFEDKRNNREMLLLFFSRDDLLLLASNSSLLYIYILLLRHNFLTLTLFQSGEDKWLTSCKFSSFRAFITFCLHALASKWLKITRAGLGWLIVCVCVCVTVYQSTCVQS